jgi:endonuclease IV
MAYKPFPKMIYHETEQSRVVLSDAELREYLLKGWSTTRVSYSEANDLRARIEKAKEELRLMEMKLATIEGINDIKIEAPVEKMPVVEETPAPIFMKKKGRPRG